MSELREFGRILIGNRQPNEDFSPEVRAFIMGATAAGASQTAIADALGTRRQRIGEQIRRFKDHHTLRSRPRGRPPKVFGPRAERRIFRYVRRRPRSSYQDLRNAIGRNANNSTFRRVLARRKLKK
ncbi:hypothetical protein F5B18DRAFT_612035 [Nemania serpens]|nr:hypothetical protein F5B18DRAFT_612035 [Nemania serpens]